MRGEKYWSIFLIFLTFRMCSFTLSVATDSRHTKFYRPLLESDGSLNFGEEIFLVAGFEETIEFGKH